MLKDYLIFILLVIGTGLLILATWHYPGGSAGNENSEGYIWMENYISNLLNPTAVNGEINGARPWAMGGVLCLSIGFGIFFVHFSERVQIRSAALDIKYLGIAATSFAMLTIFPSLHDLMVTLSSILTLLVFFYITIIVLKSDLTFFKFMSVIFLLTFYLGAYMYFTRSYLEFMPLAQKVIYLVKIIWVLVLMYFTRLEDFKDITR